MALSENDKSVASSAPIEQPRRTLSEILDDLGVRLDQLDREQQTLQDCRTEADQLLGQTRPDMPRMPARRRHALRSAMPDDSRPPADPLKADPLAVLRSEVYGWLVAQSHSNDDPARAMARYIPVRLYLSDVQDTVPADCLAYIAGILDGIGFAVSCVLETPCDGALHALIVRSRDAMTRLEMELRLSKLSGLFSTVLHQHQARAHNRAMVVIENLIRAIDSSPVAAVQIGPVAVVKNRVDSLPGLLCRTLSQKELLTVEAVASGLKAPESLLNALTGGTGEGTGRPRGVSRH